MARVLIVEDTEGVRQTLEIMLESSGHELDIAENGRAALDKLHEKAYDLVITDIIMPEVDGNDVILEVRRMSPSPKVIAISGGGMKVDKDEALMLARTQADMVLKKPFTHRELQDAVFSALDGKSDRST
jgi:CheY-like chemotaxis protein